MITKTLDNGIIQHTLTNWIGIQQPNEPMTKTKWRRTDFKYYTINGYSVTEDNKGKISCNCKGFYFRKNCKHIKGLRP
tara:strand:- start:199 stop:432 length:234 start_codon:yes stop_codon:yes gene_type:complete